MELSEFINSMTPEQAESLKTVVNNRFGTGYFGLDAGIYVSASTDAKYQYNIQFNNFSSVSGWATIGGLRWEDKRKKWVLSFRGKGLGRTGKYR